MNAVEDPSSLNECIEAVTIDDEDDYTGYFLEPTANSVNMVERIAEANRKLYEEDNSQKDDPDRPRKVQFSESVVNFEPDNYDSDEFVESDNLSTNSEEEPVNDDTPVDKEPERSQRPKTASKKQTWDIKEEPEEVIEEIQEEPKEDVKEDPQQVKVLLVMLPREQSSSCESVIGEEISEEKPGKPEPKAEEKEEENVVESPKQLKVPAINQCKLAKVSPDLNCSPKTETKKWQRKEGLKCKKAKTKTEKDSIRPKSSGNGKRDAKEEAADRPKSAPDRRRCCIPQMRLPKYNGFRSEYGLSAEQLQERRRKTFELRQQKRIDRVKKRQEEIQKRIENEENFSQWLCSKRRGNVVKKPTQIDTLSRSDVYIQNHAVYASRRGISYSVEYGLSKKKLSKPSKMVLLDKKHEKIINLDRLFDNVSRVKHTYRIFLGNGQKFGL